jgi:curved DNA-binding protein CbpA
MIDYYEFLQISPHADAETVHRVYRYLAARFHPDNPKSGDSNLFCMVKAAYDVLSDSAKRAEYDAARRNQPVDSEPFSSTVDFMDDLEGELNRRLAVLAVLYSRRRGKPDQPDVTLMEIEDRMGFPREYLDFTLWYLVKKRFVTRTDNAQFTLTADGVDFVETQRVSIPALNKMLTTESAFSGAETVDVNEISVGTRKTRAAAARVTEAGPSQAPIVLPTEPAPTAPTTESAPNGEWRPGMPDRRKNRDRRGNSSGGRRSSD